MRLPTKDRRYISANINILHNVTQMRVNFNNMVLEVLENYIVLYLSNIYSFMYFGE